MERAPSTDADMSRTCVTCRAVLDRGDGFRFVLGDDGVVAFDARAKSPGRGAWCCAKKTCLDGVRQRGRFERSFEGAVRLPPAPWPLDLASAQVARRQREFLGLAMRVGQLKTGGNVVESALRSGWATTLVLASDAGDTVAADHSRRAAAFGVPLLTALLSSESIGAALGKGGPRSAVALSRGTLVESLVLELKRGADLL